MFKMIKGWFCKAPAKPEPKTIGDLIKQQMEVREDHEKAAREVVGWLNADKKVKAIKAIRMATGAGLNESKMLVDKGIRHSFSEVRWVEEIASINHYPAS